MAVSHKNYDGPFTRYIVDDPDGIASKVIGAGHISEDDASKIKDVLKYDEFLKELPKMDNAIIYVAGVQAYNGLLGLRAQNLIHIGLRSFTRTDFKDLKYVFIGTNRIVYAELENSVDRMKEFLSPMVEKKVLPLPKTYCVGLTEGAEYLKRFFIPIKHCMTTMEYYDWYRNPDKLNYANEIGLDFESYNHKNPKCAFPENDGFNISGFSLSTVNKFGQGISVFFDFRKDWQYDKTKYNDSVRMTDNAFMKLFKEFMDIHQEHIWAYNSGFEYSALYFLHHKPYRIQDAWRICICDDKRGNLKYNVQYALNCPSWDDDLDYEQNCLSVLGSIMSFEEYFSYFTRKTIFDVDFTFEDYSKMMNAKGVPLPTGEKGTLLITNTINCVNNLIKINREMDADTVNPHYWRVLYEQNWGDAWAACDPFELGTYCCYDSFYGERLGALYMPAYGETCYDMFKNHSYIQAEWKMGGIRVDKNRLFDMATVQDAILVNYEVMQNDIYIKQYLESIDETIYHSDKITPQLQKLIASHPECVVSDYTLLAKMLLNVACANCNKNGTTLSEELSELVGCDVTLEYSYLDVYKDYVALAGFLRKKTVVAQLGMAFDVMLGIGELNKEFTRKVVETVQPEYDHYLDMIRRQYFNYINGIEIERVGEAIQKLQYWKSKVNATSQESWIPYTVKMQKLLAGKNPIIKNTKDLNGNPITLVRINTWEEYLRESFPTITKNEADFIWYMPLESIQILSTVKDIKNETLWNTPIQILIPQQVLSKFNLNSLPSLSGLATYYRMLKLKEEINMISTNRIDECPKIGNKKLHNNMYQNKIFNPYSSQDWDSYVSNLKSWCLDQALFNRFFCQYYLSNFMEMSKGDTREAKLEIRMNALFDAVKNREQVIETCKNNKTDVGYTWMLNSKWDGSTLAKWNGAMFTFFMSIYALCYNDVNDYHVGDCLTNKCEGAPTDVKSLPRYAELDESDRKFLDKLWDIGKYWAIRYYASTANKDWTTYTAGCDQCRVRVDYYRDDTYSTCYGNERHAEHGTVLKNPDGSYKLDANGNIEYDPMYIGKGQFYVDRRYSVLDHVLRDGTKEEMKDWPDTWYVSDATVQSSVKSKRNSASYHTWRHESDVQFCLKAPEGYISSYFDISQLEPRTIAYVSDDKSFRYDVYDAGNDAYVELAKLAFPKKFESMEFKAFRGAYRPIAKTMLISLCYGRGLKSMSLANNLPMEDCIAVKDGMMGGWKQVAAMMAHKKVHLLNTGNIDTILGDKLSGNPLQVATTAVNYAVQGSSSIIATSCFSDCLQKSMEVGFNTSLLSVIHDSTQQYFPIKHLFDMMALNYIEFRRKIQDRFDIDYKFDMDVAKEVRDNISFSVNWIDKTFKLSGRTEAIDEIIKFLGNRIEITEREDKVDRKNHFNFFIGDPGKKDHNYTAIGDFINESNTDIKGKILCSVYEEEWMKLDAIDHKNGLNSSKLLKEGKVEVSTDELGTPTETEIKPVSTPVWKHKPYFDCAKKWNEKFINPKVIEGQLRELDDSGNINTEIHEDSNTIMKYVPWRLAEKVIDRYWNEGIFSVGVANPNAPIEDYPTVVDDKVVYVEAA